MSAVTVNIVNHRSIYVWRGNNLLIRDQLCKKLMGVLDVKLQIPEEMLQCCYFDEPLTGGIFHLNGKDLIYLYFEVEKEFRIVLESCDVVGYGFNTINRILDTIEKRVAETIEFGEERLS